MKLKTFEGLLLLAVVLGCTALFYAGNRAAKQPELSTANGLAIRDAQVNYLRALDAAQKAAVPVQSAQAALTEAVNKGLKDAGVNPADYDVTEAGGKLVIIHKAAPENKPAK